MKLLTSQMLQVVLGSCAYAIGAIPTGFLLARLVGIADIRSHGSGNIGATNVARLLGVHYFIPVFLIDSGKAYFYLWLVAFLFGYSSVSLLIAAALLLIGNGYSIFLQGSGGKGVATAVGIVLFLNPIAAVVTCIAWVVGMVVTQTVGISSVMAAVILPLYVFCASHESSLFFLMLFIALWVVWRHRNNMSQYFLTKKASV